MKAVILARVSTKDQEDFGHSLPAQTQKLREYAEKKGFEVIKEFSFSESAGTKIRKKFEDVLDYLKSQKEMPVLLCQNVDRVTRNFRDAVDLDDMRINQRLEIHFVQDGFVLSSKAGGGEMFMWEAKVFLAKQYINRLTDDAVRSMNHKLEHGEWVSKAPLGYLSAKDDAGRSTVIVDQERAFLVKRLFQDYSTGTCSLNELRRKSKDWGLRTLKGNALTPQTLHRLIQNPFYYGVMVLKGKEYPHNYPLLISKELFDTCQRIRIGNRRNQAVKETKNSFIFRGLIKCAVSGRKVTSDLKKNRYVYLICHDPKNPKKKLFVPETKIMEQIEQVFQSLQIPANVLAEIIDDLRQTHESEKKFHNDSIKRLHRESEDLSKKLDKLTDLLLDESITKDVYHKKHQDMTQRQYEINRELESHHEGNDQFKIALSMLVTLASKSWDIFKSSTIDEKRQLIGYVFSNLEMEGANLRYTLKTPFNLFVDLADHQNWRPLRDSNPCCRRERAMS
jgi:site-specific DNA recombinase